MVQGTELGAAGTLPFKFGFMAGKIGVKDWKNAVEVCDSFCEHSLSAKCHTNTPELWRISPAWWEMEGERGASHKSNHNNKTKMESCLTVSALLTVISGIMSKIIWGTLDNPNFQHLSKRWSPLAVSAKQSLIVLITEVKYLCTTTPQMQQISSLAAPQKLSNYGLKSTSDQELQKHLVSKRKPFVMCFLQRTPHLLQS